MAEQDPAGEPNVRQDLGLMCLIGWCQAKLARFTMRPTDYKEYVRIAWLHYNEGRFNDEFLRQTRELLQDPDYAHLRVCWDVLYRDFIGEVQLKDNPLHLFPVVVCAVLNAIVCFALFGSLALDVPGIRARLRASRLLNMERLRAQKREIVAIRRALGLIGRYQDQFTHTGETATIKTALEMIRCYIDKYFPARQANSSPIRSPDSHGGSGVYGA